MKIQENYRYIAYSIPLSFFSCLLLQNVISNVLNNAKEMLKMLVTMSGYMTNTISICQEYVSSNTTVRLSTTSTGSEKYINILAFDILD